MPQSPVGQIGFVLRVCPFARRPELGLFRVRLHVFAFRFQIINHESEGRPSI
jgi:hypothetical protein